MEGKWRKKWLWPVVVICLIVLLTAAMASADRGQKSEALGDDVSVEEEMGASDYLLKVVNFLWQPNESSYQHVWPVRIPIFFPSFV